MEKVKRALLGDRKAQAELTRQGRKLPCHVCGKKAKIMFREGLFVIMCSDEYCDCLCVAESVRSMAIRKWNERPEILTPEEIRRLEEME
mgnify:CR=1 FL=1